MSKLHPGIEPQTFGLQHQLTYPLIHPELAKSLSVKGNTQDKCYIILLSTLFVQYFTIKNVIIM